MEKTRDPAPDEHQPTEAELQRRRVARASASHDALETHLQHHRDRRRFQDTLPEYQMVTRYHERLLRRSHERRQQKIAGLGETPGAASSNLLAGDQSVGFGEGCAVSSPRRPGIVQVLHRLLRAFRGAKDACTVASPSVD